MKRAIFLDRDNTIILNDGDLGNPDEVRLIRGAAHAIGSLRQLGYRIIVVSNQGGVARGRYTERDVDAVHERIAQMVHDSAGAIIDRFYYCPFHPEGTVAEYSKEHPWRKPQPGMLLEAARSLDLDLKECWMVGDGERDIEAGRAAGCQTILITRKTSVNTKADFQAGSLAEAAAIIAQNRVRPRQIIPPAPTVVVSPKVAHEARHAEALTGRAGAAIAADHGPDERIIAAPAPAARPQATVDVETAVAVEIESDAVEDAFATQAEVEQIEESTQAADAVETDEPVAPAQEDAETPDSPTPAAPRRDPFRHIPLRVQGIERPQPHREAPPEHAERLLTELLGEVRSWRHSQREFTPPLLLGSLTSLGLVILAVLLGIYLEPAVATPWIGATIVAQLGVVVFIAINLRR